MELAKRGRVVVRSAKMGDKRAISRLLRSAPYYHLHADWRLPADWLGWPEFALAEGSAGSDGLTGCLVATADPPPAAWVRIAAASSGQDPEHLFRLMLEHILPVLAQSGVDQLGWLLAQPWPGSWLRELGFSQVNAITTYALGYQSRMPSINQGVQIRPALIEDMKGLADMEVEAFEPLWRHSAEGLSLAYQQATEFQVAVLSGVLVGFQYSVPGSFERGHEHLARITVKPSYQGLGVGRSLLASAISGYRNRSVSRVSLNTQVDNQASHQLYKSFGFQALGDEIPVWARQVV